MGVKQFLATNKKKIGVVLLIALVLMQFKRIDKTNPPVNASQDMITLTSPPPTVATLFKNACYDCHSNETKYPWYTNIAPLSWWIKGHIDNGRANLNFSEWGGFSKGKAEHKLEESAEKIEKTEMPLTSYLLGHPEARISKKERKLMVAWCMQQALKYQGGEGDKDDHDHDGHDHDHHGHSH